VLVAAGLSQRDGLLAPVPLLVAFLGSWLIHVGGVFFDNYELLRRFPELREHPELTAALDRGTLKLKTLLLAIFACFGLTALSGPYLFAVGGYPVLLFAAIGIASSLSYAGGPLAYARHGLAEPFFFLMFGVVAVYGTYYIQAAAHGAVDTGWRFIGDMPVEPLVLGLPIGALVTGVLLIDDIRDRDFDRIKGWRTATVRFGPGWSRVRFGVLMAGAYAAPPLFWLSMNFSAWVLLPLVTLPMAMRILRAVLEYDRTRDLLPMSPATSKLSMIYALLLAVGIAV
jgi:1,4-dihydroxy-2-naphthoate octaprenyltransferase